MKKMNKIKWIAVVAVLLLAASPAFAQLSEGTQGFLKTIGNKDGGAATTQSVNTDGGQVFALPNGETITTKKNQRVRCEESNRNFFGKAIDFFTGDTQTSTCIVDQLDAEGNAIDPENYQHQFDSRRQELAAENAANISEGDTYRQELLQDISSRNFRNMDGLEEDTVLDFNVPSVDASAACTAKIDGHFPTIFEKLSCKAAITLQDLKPVIFAIAGFGIIAFSFAAIFGKINYKHLASIIFSLFLVAMVGPFIGYMTGSGRNPGTEQLKFGQYLPAPEKSRIDGSAALDYQTQRLGAMGGIAGALNLPDEGSAGKMLEAYGGFIGAMGDTARASRDDIGYMAWKVGDDAWRQMNPMTITSTPPSAKDVLNNINQFLGGIAQTKDGLERGMEGIEAGWEQIQDGDFRGGATGIVNSYDAGTTAAGKGTGIWVNAIARATSKDKETAAAKPNNNAVGNALINTGKNASQDMRGVNNGANFMNQSARSANNSLDQIFNK